MHREALGASSDGARSRDTGHFKRLLLSAADVLQTEHFVGPERAAGLVALGSLEQVGQGVALGSGTKVIDATKVELGPDVVECLDEMSDISLRVTGRGGDAKTLKTTGDGRKVDGLDVAAVLAEEHVTGSLGLLGRADESGNNVRRVVLKGDTSGDQSVLGLASADLLQLAGVVALHENLDGSRGTGQDGRRQGGREDKLRSEGTDDVDEARRTCNVTANVSVGLAERASDDVDTVHDGARGAAVGLNLPVQVLSNTCTARTIHANGVNLVEESDGAVTLGEVADLCDRTDGTAHAVNRLESDDLGGIDGDRLKLCLEIGHVVVLEDHLASAAMLDTLDHRRVVARITEDDAVGQLGSENGEGSIVGCVARAKDERALLAVKVGKHCLRLFDMLVVASNVAGTTSAGAVLHERVRHGLEHPGVTTHVLVIVGTPNGDFLLFVSEMAARRLSGEAVDVVEVAVGLVCVLGHDLAVVKGLVIETWGLLRLGLGWDAHTGTRHANLLLDRLDTVRSHAFSGKSGGLVGSGGSSGSASVRALFNIASAAGSDTFVGVNPVNLILAGDRSLARIRLGHVRAALLVAMRAATGVKARSKERVCSATEEASGAAKGTGAGRGGGVAELLGADFESFAHDGALLSANDETGGTARNEGGRRHLAELLHWCAAQVRAYGAELPQSRDGAIHGGWLGGGVREWWCQDENGRASGGEGVCSTLAHLAKRCVGRGRRR